MPETYVIWRDELFTFNSYLKYATGYLQSENVQWQKKSTTSVKDSDGEKITFLRL